MSRPSKDEGGILKSLRTRLAHRALVIFNMFDLGRFPLLHLAFRTEVVSESVQKLA